MDRILVAEDNSALRLLYAIWLESGGFEVTAVADGRAALAALERRPLPDAVLLDIEMPFVDGLSVCRYLHALDPSIPVLVVTGVEGARGDALAAGASDVLSKPCDPAQIVGAVRREAARLRLTA